jgi:hypothetical protein
LELSRHQAKVLTAALLFVKEFRELPEGNAIRNVPEGITSELVKTECLMIQKEVLLQFMEQDLRVRYARPFWEESGKSEADFHPRASVG